jgi:hypothetical protein
MNKIKAFVVISRFNENVGWINELTDDYIIYNKGAELDGGVKQKMVPNIGANQYDICSYIYENYENLPPLIAFLQGNPFDHCLKNRFDLLIRSEQFTPIFGDRNYPNGVYSESNDSWYLNQPWQSHKPPCKFDNFDEYAKYIFENYEREDHLTFPPGSQIIVERERCLFYSKNFWKKLMDIFPTQEGINGGREAHIIERSIQLIFENKYQEKQ